MKELICYHMIALAIGCVLDLIIGDPHGIPHPVVWIGRLISFLEKKMYPDFEAGEKAAKSSGKKLYRRDRLSEIRDEKRLKCRGSLLVIIVVVVTVGLTALVLTAAYACHAYAGIAVEAILTCYIMASRNLYDESMIVMKDLEAYDICRARSDLSMIVGRDTMNLDEEGIIRATVETVAENTSDGVCAPLFYTILGGPVAGMLYKAVNTMDSMLGYRNERYEYFGCTAAKTDDVVNFIPSRISAMLIIVSSGLLSLADKNYSPSGAYRIWRRDRRNHPSPNSAQTESACAGALMIRLGGTSYYGGRAVDKPTIGDPLRRIDREHVRMSDHLMFASEFVMLILAEIVFCIWYVIIRLP